VVRTLANDDDEYFLEGKSLFQQHQDRHSHVLAWLRAFLSLFVGRPSVLLRVDFITESLDLIFDFHFCLRLEYFMMIECPVIRLELFVAS
jgi:hypothetical protein